jgi:hypothetical protein
MATKAGRRRREIERFLQKEFKKVDNQAKRQPPEYILGMVEENGKNFIPAGKRNEMAEISIHGTSLNPLY